MANEDYLKEVKKRWEGATSGEYMEFFRHIHDDIGNLLSIIDAQNEYESALHRLAKEFNLERKTPEEIVDSVISEVLRLKTGLKELLSKSVWDMEA